MAVELGDGTGLAVEVKASGDLFLETVGTLLAILFLSAPLAQVVPLHSTPSRVAVVNPANLLALHANCASQTIYGLFRPVPAAVPANLYGLAASIYYLGTCWHSVWRLQKSGSEIRGWDHRTAVACVVAVSLSAAMYLYAARPWHPSASEHVGHLALLFSVCLFASPLSVLTSVLAERSSELLPPVNCFLGLLCSGCWSIIGLRAWSKPIYVPNMLGVLLSLLQLALILIFPSKKGKISVKDSKEDLA
ncbi:unnamed protein product [Durusdinium trenchii]|uniref:Uncharacterized protein n=2 Tax=Durusdinium trenchii TaxID=1381693 RepID=A0ABP0NXX0_9DINO